MSLIIAQMRDVHKKIQAAKIELAEADQVRAEKRRALCDLESEFTELEEELMNPGQRYPLLEEPPAPEVPALRKLLADPPPEPAPSRVRKHRAVPKPADA